MKSSIEKILKLEKSKKSNPDEETEVQNDFLVIPTAVVRAPDS